jgi:hypothetical protein
MISQYQHVQIRFWVKEKENFAGWYACEPGGLLLEVDVDDIEGNLLGQQHQHRPFSKRAESHIQHSHLQRKNIFQKDLTYIFQKDVT